MTWLALVDADEGSGIVIILLAAMAVGIVLAITIAMRQQQEELGEETTTGEDDVKDYDDVDSEIVVDFEAGLLASFRDNHETLMNQINDSLGH